MSAPPGGTASGDTAHLVRSAWSSVLGHDQFSDSDDFFAVGGTSLRAMRVARALGRPAGVRVPVRVVMENRTVTELAAAFRAHLEGSAGTVPRP